MDTSSVVASSVVGALASGQRFFADARARDLDALPVDQLTAETRAVQGVLREVQALSLALLAAADRRDAARAAGEPSLTALVAREAGVSRKDAARQVRLANQLTTAPATREALGKPGMSTEKARLITDALEQLPSGLSDQDRATVEDALVAAAPDMSLEQFRTKTKRALEHVNVTRADDIENRRLEREEAHQRRASEFWIGQADEHTGLVAFGGKTDPLTADILRSALEAHTSPRSRRDPVDTRPDPRQANGEAFNELIRHLPKDGYGNHGGISATLMVTISEESLRGRTNRAGVTDHGTRISASELRQIACNTGILPAVLGGDSLPLDVGREKRDFTPAQRRALAHRDQGCAHPGCDRPPGWCEAHHISHWQHGGPSDLTNGVLLCAHHHRLVHSANISIRLAPHDQIPEFQIHGHWQRNHRYTPQPALC